MKRSLSAVGVLAMILAAAPTTAQTKPSFAGKWTLLAGPNAAPGGRGRLGQDFTVSQNDKTLRTTTDDPERPDLNVVYNLDGSESRNSITFNGRSLEVVSRAKWAGSKLVITSTINFGGNPSESTQIWSLDASGNLIIEGTANISGTATTTKVTYKKV